MVRCKFTCTSKEPAADSQGAFVLTFDAVVNGSDENQSFFRWTPSGSIRFACANQSAADQFTVGYEYFVDLTEAEAAGFHRPAVKPPPDAPDFDEPEPVPV